MGDDQTARAIALVLAALAVIMFGLNAYSIASEDYPDTAASAAVQSIE